MGIRLIVEVLDHWQDAGLTPGERWDLLVLAENANDGTRLTFGPVHAQHILDRANKSPKGWKNAITALMRKKVITTHVPGRIKQVAVYHLEHLCPEPPHEGYKGQCTRAPKEGHPADDPVAGEGHPADDPMGHPADDPLAQEGHPADAKRVIQQMTPTPPNSSSKESPLTTPSSSVAEDAPEPSVDSTDGGGGGGEIDSSEEQDKPIARAIAFVDSLDYRGKPPGQKRRTTLQMRVAAAFKAGWSERGLARYLDISDDSSVRSAAAVYLHRLSEEELPEAEAEPPAPQPTRLPPACQSCLEFSHGAATNVRLRTDRLSFHGGPCPRCHPSMVPGDWHWSGKDQSSTGARAAAHTADDYASGSVDDLYGPRQLTGTDAKVAGWMALSRQLADSNEREFSSAPFRAPRPMVARNDHQPFRNPEDQSVYDEPLLPSGPPPDQSVYDEDF